MESRPRPPRHLGRPGRSFVGLMVLLSLAFGLAQASTPPSPQTQNLGPYIVIGWNDLGMHCANQNFQDLCLLPPYNTFWATVIRRGNGSIPPTVMGSDFHVNYSFQDNTYSVGKTNFWAHVQALFGTLLAPDVGLRGHAMPGAGNTPQPIAFDAARRWFRAEGIPITAYDDAGRCACFFNQSGVRFWEMAPAANLASTRVCLARPGVEYAVYTATNSPFTVDLSAAPEATFRACWYDPRAGRFDHVRCASPRASGWRRAIFLPHSVRPERAERVEGRVPDGGSALRLRPSGPSLRATGSGARRDFR